MSDKHPRPSKTIQYHVLTYEKQTTFHCYSNSSCQVGFRLITFAMNAFVLRHISRDVLGLINVRLNLLDDTIMFLSKECFRLACLSHTTGREGWQKMINLMWLSLPLATLVASGLSWVWVSLLPSPEPHLMSQYTKAVWIVGASGVVQMLAEPPWVAAQLMLLVRLRVVLDTVWVLTRFSFSPSCKSLYFQCG